MKIARIALWIVAALAALLSVALLAVWLLFDAAAVKSKVEKLVLEHTGRQLVIGGNLGLAVFPRLGVEMDGVRLSERGAPQQPFAAVERVRLGVKLLPLLQRRVEADEILLVAPQLRIVRDRQGQLNIADLLGQPGGKTTESAPPPAPPPAPKPEAVAMPQVALAGLRIEKGRLAYRDEASAKEIVVDDLAVRLGEIGTRAAGRLEFGASMTIDGKSLRTDLTSDYNIDANQRRFGLSGLAGQIKGALANLTDVEVKLKLASAGLDGEAPLQLQGVEVSGGGQVASDRFVLKLLAPRLEVAGERVGGDPLQIEASLTGAGRRLAASVEAAEWQRQGTALNMGRLALRWDLAVAQLASQGTLASRLEVLTPPAGPQITLGDYRGQAEVRHPALVGGTLKADFEGSARTDLGAGSAAGRNRLHFDETTVQATWGLPRLNPWRATFDATVDRLNLDRYLPPKPAAGAQGKGAALTSASAPVPAAADTPVDLGALRGLDLAGDLRVGALQVHGARLANLRAKLQARDGRLVVAPLAAELYEGRASGQLSAAASSPPRLAVQATLEGVNLQPLLRDAAGQDYLAGRGRVNLDVAATGGSVNALKRSLQGTAALGLRDGAVKGINLAKSLRELKARFGAGDDVVQAASRDEKTDFSELQASFRIAQGVARNEDLSAKSPFFRISGGGAVDIGESRIDYLVKANVVNTSTGQDGKGLEHVRGLTVPVRLSGPFDKLSYKLELSQLAQEAAKARLKEKLGEKLGGAAGATPKEAVKQRLEEKLDQKLKGLFGR